MLGTTIIVFREVFEVALIVSIVMVASKGAAGRDLWVSYGIGAGIVGACLVAAFAARIAAASGIGRELLNATSLSSRSECLVGTTSGCRVTDGSSRRTPGLLAAP